MNLALLLLAAAPVFAQKKVFVSDNVLKVAEQARFDYKGTLKKATAKDDKALAELFEFIRLLENVEADEHAMTCLELIPVATDKVFSQAVQSRSTKMKAALLRRITAAQERSQKAELKKPMEEWAPYSWKALNNIQFAIEDTTKKAAAANSATGAGTGVGQAGTGTGTGVGQINTGSGSATGIDAGAAKPDAGGAILAPTKPADTGKKTPAKRKDN